MPGHLEWNCRIGQEFEDGDYNTLTGRLDWHKTDVIPA
jgi:hypothetical protein